MKISVTSLSDYQRGGAWPSSVRTVKRSVKSDNERDPHPYLPPLSPDKAHYRETACAKQEEGAATTGQYAPNVLGYTRATKDRTMGSHAERRRYLETYS